MPSNNTVQALLELGTWDYVVIQEQSQKPSFPDWQVAQDVFPYAEALCDTMRAYNACTEPVFFMTWGRKNGDASNCAVWPPVCTFEGMNQRLRNSYMQMGVDNNATVSPVGAAWKMAIDSGYVPDLYTPDQSHPSEHGSYLAACVHYATMFQKSPVGNPFHFTLNAADATFLQQMAHNVVIDSMDTWRINFNKVQADFSHSVSSTTVQFTDSSTHAESWVWDFGDGNTSTMANPTHTYATDGTYTVCLYASDTCSADTICYSVNVNCIDAVADFGELVSGLSVGFVNNATNATSYSWDFGDGNTSTATDPAHTYANSGTYSVCLVASNNCHSDTLCTLISVGCNLPTADFSYSSNTLQASFTDASNGADNITWIFGDGVTGTGSMVQHQYPDTGWYEVCQIATNLCGSDTTCSMVYVGCQLPQPSFTSSAVELAVTFTNNSSNANSYTWDFGDGFTGSGAQQAHNFPGTGTYTVCLTATNGCGSQQYCDTVSVSCPPPLADFTSTDSLLEVVLTDGSTGATSWSWDFGDGNSSTLQNPIHSYDTAGTYTIVLTASSPCGSTDFSTTVSVTQPQDTSTNVPDVALQALLIYPNPAREAVQVELPERNGQPASFQLLDVSGRLVRAGILAPSGQLQLNGIPAGLYWLQASVGQVTYRARLVVQ